MQGIVDAFQAESSRLRTGQTGIQLEGSKVFAKEMMHTGSIPTARFGIFSQMPATAKAYIREAAFPVVVKADGLAAGKGVIVTSSTEEAVCRR